MMRFCFSIFLFITLLWSAQCAKILIVFPLPAYSHFSVGFRLAKELADRDHQVTVISPFPQKNPIKNYRDVDVADPAKFAGKIEKTLLERSKSTPLENINRLMKMGTELTEKTFQNKNVQELLNSKETFDLVIFEHFMNDAQVGLAHHFKAPYILVAPNAASNLINDLVANPGPSSYVPNAVSELTIPMNFWQRLQNFYFNIYFNAVKYFIHIPQHRKIFKKYIKTDFELDDVLYNVSLVFTNSHVSVQNAIPHVPNLIEIGGFHIDPPKKLPEDLQTYLDESKEGVILFSMGSNLKSKDLTPEMRDGILKSFSKIKQKVLWKFEIDLPEAPKNVKIMKWVPQQDVLAHPNTVAFISHGGILSTIETIYHGVPIIGIPVFGDQKSNIAAAVSEGYAVGVPLFELSEKKLSWALDEVLNNPKYRENVKRRSKLMHDQPLKPIDAVIFWIEYVIRHKGAPHLRSAGVNLKWSQREMIDIFAFLALVTTIALVVICKIIRFCCKLISKPKPKVAKEKKQN